MPIYEYTCEKCGATTEALCKMDEADAPFACEKCGSEKTETRPQRFLRRPQRGRRHATTNGRRRRLRLWQPERAMQYVRGWVTPRRGVAKTPGEESYSLCFCLIFRQDDGIGRIDWMRTKDLTI